jgi:hypothetical protein
MPTPRRHAGSKRGSSERPGLAPGAFREPTRGPRKGAKNSRAERTSERPPLCQAQPTEHASLPAARRTAPRELTAPPRPDTRSEEAHALVLCSARRAPRTAGRACLPAGALPGVARRWPAFPAQAACAASAAAARPRPTAAFPLGNSTAAAGHRPHARQRAANHTAMAVMAS